MAYSFRDEMGDIDGGVTHDDAPSRIPWYGQDRDRWDLHLSLHFVDPRIPLSRWPGVLRRLRDGVLWEGRHLEVAWVSPCRQERQGHLHAVLLVRGPDGYAQMLRRSGPKYAHHVLLPCGGSYTAGPAAGRVFQHRGTRNNPRGPVIFRHTLGACANASDRREYPWTMQDPDPSRDLATL